MPSEGWRNRIVRVAEEPPESLLANPRNWRRHPAAQREALRGSLSTVGWVQQVMVNERTGHVVDGHARVEEAISRGEATVPVLYVDLDENEEGIVLATLDPIGAMAVRDREALTELVDGVTVDDEALRRLIGELIGIKPAVGFVDPDDIPDPDPRRVNLGDVFILGKHRVMCGDAMNAEHVAKLLDGASPRLLVTDPPYGVELDPRWRDGVYNKLGPAALPYMTEDYSVRTISNDTRADWSAAFELVPSLEVAYVWHAGAKAVEVGQGLQRIGFDLRQQIMWAKPIPVIGRSAYNWQHEPCWYGVRKGSTSGWLGDHLDTTVWEAASPKSIMSGSGEEKEDHPTQKPILCHARPISHHDGDVYDPFVGSGTSVIAAEQYERSCFAMDVDPRFVKVTIARWERFTGRKAEQVGVPHGGTEDPYEEWAASH